MDNYNNVMQTVTLSKQLHTGQAVTQANVALIEEHNYLESTI